MPLVSYNIQTWWVDLTRKKSDIDKRVERWLDQCEALYSECKALERSAKTLFAEILNVKLEKKVWDDPRLPGKLVTRRRKLDIITAGMGKNKPRAYAMLREERALLTALKEAMTTAIDEFKVLQDEKYVYRTFSVPFLTQADVDKINAILHDTKIVYHPSEVEVFVALRASGISDLDITREWDGIDAFVAGGEIDITSQIKKIMSVTGWCGEGEPDRAFYIEHLRTVILTQRKEAEAKIQKALKGVVGQTYLIKHRAKVYSHIKIRQITLATLSATLATGRLIATAGADPTAYYSIIRSVISVGSLLIREALNDIQSTCTTIEADLREMSRTMGRAATDLSGEWWMDQTTAVIDKLNRTLYGFSVTMMSGSLSGYIDHQLFFSRKLADFRTRLAEQSVKNQQLLADIDGVIKLWEAEKKATDDPDEIAALEDAGQELAAHRRVLELTWAETLQTITTIDAAYVSTFAEMEEALTAYRAIIDTWFKPCMERDGFIEQDGVVALYRAISVYNTGAAISKTANIYKLTGRGITALVSLVAAVA